MPAPGSAEPIEITVSTARREVSIRWRDGHESRYTLDLLRRQCPCALCVDQRGKQAAPATLSVLSGPVVRAGEIQASEVRPVGRYAVTFVWSDGHDSGIYSYAFLRDLCPCPACRARH
jgi:DUF971 family protein